MMTVAEAELIKQAAEKGRSASFSVPAQQLCRLQDLEAAAVGTRSQQELSSPEQEDCQQHQQGMPSVGKHHNLLRDGGGGSESCNSNSNINSNNSPTSRLKAAQHSRRSQSCRVASSKNSSRPHVRRRLVQGNGSASSSTATIDNNQNTDDNAQREQPQQQQQEQSGEGDSYNPFLNKVPSCGRLLALAPEDCMYVQDDAEESPVPLRRSASARRPNRHGGCTDSPVDHSPTPPRHPKQQTRPRVASSTRRAQTSSSKRGGGLLEVRDPNESSQDTLDTDQYLLRNFATTHKGSIINRGDSFRRRRSRSNSIQPPGDLPLLQQQQQQQQQHQQQQHQSSNSSIIINPTSSQQQQQQQQQQHQQLSPAAEGTTASAAHTPDADDGDAQQGPPNSGGYRMPILGATGVGKTALIHQFRTSECINAYDCPAPGDEKESTVSIVLNSYESDIVFVNVTTPEEFQEETQLDMAGWLVVYSITDKASFTKASDQLAKLQSMSLLRGKAIILVANKCELVRSRTVGVDDGRDLACSYGAKFMEISVGMNHKCDDLLVGILHQLRIKEEEKGSERSEKSSWTRNRSLMRASMKAKRLIHRVMGRTDSKYKSCEDFNN